MADILKAVLSAQICTQPEDDEQVALFVHGIDHDDRDRFFIGGVSGNRWVYQEFPTPNDNNTMWMGTGGE